MNPHFTITNSITQNLAQIERARGFLEAADLSSEWLRQMRERAFLLEAHHTTHIEGTQLTLAQAELLMAGEQVLQANADDVRELLNYREAYALVSDYLDSGAPITEGLVREIHKRLVAGVRGGHAQPGDYRRIQNYVASSTTGEIIYTPPPPTAVPALMNDLVQWLNAPGEIHPVLASGIAQFQLVHIHPFVDGNGPTSRLLSTLYLYRAGYDFKRLFTISEYYDRNRDAFYRALQGVRTAEMDLTGWLEYYVAGLETQLEEVRERTTNAIRVDAIVRERPLTERQAAAMRQVQLNGVLKIQDFVEAFPSVSRRTLQRDLKALVDMGLLVSEGQTNQTTYRLGSAAIG